MKTGRAYFLAGSGTEEARVVEIPDEPRINLTVIDGRTNRPYGVYESKGWRRLTTDAELVDALSEVKSRGEERRLRERKLAERAAESSPLAAQIHASAAIAAEAVRAALGQTTAPDASKARGR